MDILKKHLPVSGNEGLPELRKIDRRLEDKIYAAATSQSDHLQKINRGKEAIKAKDGICKSTTLEITLCHS